MKISGKTLVPTPVYEALDRSENYLRQSIKAGDRAPETVALFMDLQALLLIVTPGQETTWNPGPEAA